MGKLQMSLMILLQINLLMIIENT